MTSGGGIWDVLGIAPTDDGRAIRRAYAARLKAIDAEADPDAFIVLREAMEVALALANSPAQSNDLEYTAQDFVEHRDSTSVLADQVWTGLEDKLNALSIMLDGNGTSSQDAQLLFADILENPVLGLQDVGEAVEARLLHILAQSIPFSDRLLEVAVARFGWRAGKRWQPDVGLILDRLRDRNFIQQLRNGDHPRHSAARKLQRSPPGRRTWVKALWSDLTVAALLRDIRFGYPTAIWDFAPDLVLEWERYLAGSIPYPMHLMSPVLSPPLYGDTYPPANRPYHLMLLASVIVIPPLFWWVLLLRNKPLWLRGIGVIWVAMYILVMVSIG